MVRSGSIIYIFLLGFWKVCGLIINLCTEESSLWLPLGFSDIVLDMPRVDFRSFRYASEGGGYFFYHITPLLRFQRLRSVSLNLQFY